MIFLFYGTFYKISNIFNIFFKTSNIQYFLHFLRFLFNNNNISQQLFKQQTF